MNEQSVASSVSLRDRLRVDTRAAHAGLDAALAGLDLREADGLSVFLAVQYGALATLHCADGPDRAEAEALSAQLRAALGADLEALGHDPRGPAVPPLTADATAVLYILLGSRLGTQVLARHWRAGALGRARGAGRYFDLDPRKEAWRAFCLRAGAEPPDGPRAGRVTADAAAIFDHFGAVLADLLQSRATPPRGSHA